MSAGTLPPPANIEAEEAVLGAAMVSEPVMRKLAVVGLQPGHFYLDKHKEIFGILRRLYDRGLMPDELMMRNELPTYADYLSTLTSKCAAPSNAGQHAEVVMRQANARQNVEASFKLQESARAVTMGEKKDGESEELVREAQALIATDLSVVAMPTSPTEVAEEYASYLRSDEPDEVFELPFAELNDCVLGGLRRKQLAVFAGWSGFGKTWFLDQSLGGFHDQGEGFKLAIFGTEMSRKERVARWVATQTGISVKSQLRKTLTETELEMAVDHAHKLPFHYFEAGEWSADKIIDQAIGGGFDVVAVDVVNLIPGYEEDPGIAAGIIGRFAGLAQRANCLVILVSHLNKGRDTQATKPRPAKRDLKQTGALETHANAILFIHREQDAETGNVEPSGEAFWAKVRNGIEGTELLEFNSRFYSFSPRARRRGEEPPPAFASIGGNFP